MFLLIGLGNPGGAYEGNRHNIGFMAIRRIAEDYGFRHAARKFGGALTEGVIAGQKAYAFLPLGYMNKSGGPAGEVARYYKILPEKIIIIHDELDLPLGKVRVKIGGGHGGHNGLKSLDANIGKEYWRIRLGIGHPGDKDRVTEYVLSDFSDEEQRTVIEMLRKISQHIGLLLQGDAVQFMNKIAINSQGLLSDKGHPS